MFEAAVIVFLGVSRCVWGGALLPLRVAACFRAHLKCHRALWVILGLSLICA